MCNGMPNIFGCQQTFSLYALLRHGTGFAFIVLLLRVLLLLISVNTVLTRVCRVLLLRVLLLVLLLLLLTQCITFDMMCQTGSHFVRTKAASPFFVPQSGASGLVLQVLLRKGPRICCCNYSQRQERTCRTARYMVHPLPDHLEGHREPRLHGKGRLNRSAAGL